MSVVQNKHHATQNGVCLFLNARDVFFVEMMIVILMRKQKNSKNNKNLGK